VSATFSSQLAIWTGSGAKMLEGEAEEMLKMENRALPSKS